MSTFNGKSYQDPRNINLKGSKQQGMGLIRWDQFPAHWSTNPFASTEYGLYINSDDKLVYSALGTATILGSGGGSSVSSWDQLYQNDQTLAITGATLTWDGQHATNDVFTLTSSGAGSGSLIQITNVGTGYDINGTSSTWNFTKAGVNTMKSTTIAGTAGSTSVTLTAGDVVFSDGSIAITDADNAATFSVTNNTATSASVFVLAGSGAFTGNTTSSFMTLTASGLTTGTVLYIPVAALTTGKGINLIGTTALTTGILLNVESGTTGTSLTGAGRLFKVAHTGTTTSSGVLSEFASAATDETVILQVTASAALAAGVALKLSTASVTTGTLISVLGAALTTGNVLAATDLAALTTGYGIYLAHATSVITTGGLVLLTSSGVNTGAGGDGTMLAIKGTGQLAGSMVTVATIQTTGTTMSLISSGIMTTTGNLLTLTANSATTAAGLLRINANGLTSGIGMVITSSATAITGAGRLLYVNHTGVTGTSATLNEFASAANDETVILKVTASDVLALGTALSVSVASMTTGTGILVTASAITTGIGLSITGTGAAITTGSLISATTNSTGAVATNGIFAFNASGNFTCGAATLGAFHIAGAATTAGTILSVLGTALTTGYAMQVTGAGTYTGTGFVTVGASGTTTGNLLRIAATAATLTTGRYISAYDGANEVFGIGANGHIHVTQGTAPTIAVTQQNGITAAAITAGSTDVAGIITTTGTNNNSGTTILTVTFHKTYTTAPKVVILQPANATAILEFPYLGTINATSFQVILPASASAGATPSYFYTVIA